MTRYHETEVKHRAHNPKVAGSNPAPATNEQETWPSLMTGALVRFVRVG